MNTPLVVDLDGTLIRNDLLEETMVGFILRNPLRIFLVIKWLLSGKANLKFHLAQLTHIDVESLPYNQRVIDLIKEERSKGRVVVLATASHVIYAKKISEHLGLFDQVFATEKNLNLSAQNKCDKLVKEFGKGDFDYIGNSCDDLHVWKWSRLAYVVNPSASLRGRLKNLGNIERIISDKKNKFKIWARALRLHQWVKNFLIFVPLLASHKIHDFRLLIDGCLAFLFFGFCASHVYLFNDLTDLKNDRVHSTKRFRPIAVGHVSSLAALVVSAILLTTSFVGSFLLLPLWFGISLVSYYLLTLAYSLLLKRIAMLDIVTLASLYTMRIIAGTFAFGVALTFWMLAFSMFIFLSLSLVKRYAELHEKRALGSKKMAHGRGYYASDLEILSSMGVVSGYLSVMVLALYIQDKATITLYSHPRIIWFACPVLLFWISRIWMVTHRGQMHDDPVVFAIKDKTSWLVGALFAFVFWLAI